MSKTQTSFDGSEFDIMVNNLTGKEMKRVINRTLRISANILKKETESKFTSGLKIRKNLMTYRKDSRKVTVRKQLVKVISDRKNKQAVKIHIMGNFKAKFFEKGTNVRFTKGRTTGTTSWGKRKIKVRSGIEVKSYMWGKRRIFRYQGAKRGSNQAGYYFKNAQSEKEYEIFSNIDQAMSREIIKLSKKKNK